MPTAIEWTHETWNPVTGCTRVSPGCAHCYIERQTPMRVARRRFERVGNTETTGLVLHTERLKKLPPATRGPLIFTCSMSDLFHEDVPDAFIAEVFDVARRHPERVFQLLTKRPDRTRDWFEAWRPSFERFEDTAWPLPNVWVGVTIENARYTWRADVLRQIPAAVRFISAEPLLGSLLAERGLHGRGERARPVSLEGIDWVIAGGESGSGYRPLNLQHARELRDACQAAGVAFFFKQVGGKTPKAGGKLLDGAEICEFPASYQAAA